MEIYKYTGELFICDMSGNRVQPTIIHLKTGEKLLPIMTTKNKAYSKFHNKSRWVAKRTKAKYGFYFSAQYIEGWTDYLKNIKIIPDEEILEKYPEELI